MDVFNRVVVILLLLAGLVLLPAFFLFPRELVASLGNVFVNFERTLEMAQPALRLVVGIILAVLSFLICLSLLILELRPQKPGVVRISKADKGEILLELGSVAGRIQQAVAKIPSVVDVKPVIKRKGNGVDINLNVMTTPEVNVPEKSAEIMEAVRRLIEEEIGVKLARFQLKIKHIKAPITVKK